MKKSYIKPEIKVESAKLAAFCSGGCTLIHGILPDDVIEQILAPIYAEGSCYCYHGVAGTGFTVYGS